MPPADGAVGVSGIIRRMNEPQNSLPQAYDDEIDLWELWDTIISGRWLIIAITALFAIGGVTYALLAQEWWRADVASLDQIGELGTGDGRDVNVALIPVVTAPRRGDPIDLDFIEPLVPEPERFQITGARVVGAGLSVDRA